MTGRQQHALDYLAAGGRAGRTADEVGAELCARKGKHRADERCQYDGISGREVLRTLRKKGYVKQLRDGTGTWLALEAPDAPDERFPAYNRDGVPY